MNERRLGVVVLVVLVVLVVIVGVACCVARCMFARPLPRSTTLDGRVRMLTFRVDDSLQKVYNPCVHTDSTSFRLSTYNFCKKARYEDMIDVIRKRPDLQQCVRVTNRGEVERVVDAEDMRLFTFRGETLGVFARLTWDPRRISMHICSFSPLHTTKLLYPDSGDQEKNWTPFESQGDLFFSYSLNPHTVLKCDRFSGVCTKYYETRNTGIETTLRGGSQWVFWEEEGYYLCICHTTHADHDWPHRVYLHAWVLMDATPPFRIITRSDWFRFPAHFHDERDNVQFCSGLARGDGDSFRVSYGVADCTALELTVPSTRILSDLPILARAYGKKRPSAPQFHRPNGTDAQTPRTQ